MLRTHCLFLVLATTALAGCQIKHPSCDPYQGEKQFTGITMLTREMAAQAKPCTRQATPPVYCYQMQTDVLCYREPRPGWEGRLVGRQPVTRYEMNNKMMVEGVDAPVAMSSIPSGTVKGNETVSRIAAPLPVESRPEHVGGAAAEARDAYNNPRKKLCVKYSDSVGFDETAAPMPSQAVLPSATVASPAPVKSSGPVVLMPNN